MPASQDEILVTNVLGLTGVLCSLAVSLSSWSSVREARRVGSLGGLDTRSWPLFATAGFLWTGYAVRLGDVWLCLACGSASVIWLYFCLTAIRLLSQEEGELRPTAPEPWEGGLFRLYRKTNIKKTENGLAAGLGFTFCVTFACSPWNITGLNFLEAVITPEIKLSVFSSICGFFSLLLFIKPFIRLRRLVKRRDASTIFLPLVMAQLVQNLVWTIYGSLGLDPGVYLPYGFGAVVCMAQLLIKCMFRRAGAAVEDSMPEGKPGLFMESMTPIPFGKPVIQASSRTDAQSAADDAISWSVTADSHVVSDAAGATKSEGSPMSPSEVLTPGLRQTTTGLPDPSNRLKAQGFYEDYLKWQEGYLKRRQGGTLGAHGELTDSSVNFSTPCHRQNRQISLEVMSICAIPGEVQIEEC
ncbi:unnamed protein product [Polarella glacialis]|uniref:Bidirectional sugar transporter SWEET n=1 Tax=Polarella glacialis TaxID=89957 RepID=A0A813D5X5_POLGL|nr:unnamed protein product [Polarella glacialis]CAE8714013.1 unnamed protein product [Polarella glacialis]